MNDDKLKELLNKTDPPGIDLPKHKADLRRSLLTSDKFNRKYRFHIPAARELLLGGVFSVIIAAFILFNIFKTTGIDRESLIQPVKQNYAGFFAANSVNYFNSGLTIYGEKNESLDVDVEKWIDKTNDRYNLVVKDITTGEILDEIIITDGVLYKMANPRLQAYNTAGTLRKVVLHLSQEMVQEHHAAGDSAEFTIMTQIEDELGLLENSGLIIYHTDANVSNEVNINDESINTMKVNNSVNLNEYYKDNPLDILNDLLSADSIDYKGTFTNDENGEEYNEIVLHTAQTVQDLKKVFVRMEDTIERRSETDTTIRNHFRYFKVGIGDSLSSSIDSTCVLHDVTKTLKVSTDTGEIKEVSYSVTSGEKTYNLATTRFREQSAEVDAAEDQFDFTGKGLVTAGTDIDTNIIHLQ